MLKITSVSPYFGKPHVVRSPFPLSVIRYLQFNCVNLKTVTQAEQKASSLAGWLLCCGFCVPANVLALRRWLLETSPIVLLSWCNYWFGLLAILCFKYFFINDFKLTFYFLTNCYCRQMNFAICLFFKKIDCV